MRVITGVERESPVDEEAFRVFVKAIEIVGGPRKLVELRNLTWVPSLMAASYAVVLRDRGKTTQEIAAFLGLSTATVERMLAAHGEAVERRLRGERLDEHMAGALAKEALRRLKAGEDIHIALDSGRTMLEAVEAPPWTILVLRRIKGLHFPVEDPQQLRSRLAGISVEGEPAEEVVERISYPVVSPADLLKKLNKGVSGGSQ